MSTVPVAVAQRRAQARGDLFARHESALDQGTLAKVGCDVLMVHGRDDEPFPFAETSLPLSRALPRADVVALARCGHSPALEQPAKLVQLARMFFG